jgi:uncharacterized protein YajQ (UPF0234 family)
MNIEQLQKGIELKEKIERENAKQTGLINDYKARIKSGIYLSFGDNRSNYYSIDDETVNQIFNLVNNSLCKKITALETEFAKL